MSKNVSKKLIAFLFVIPLLSQNVYSGLEDDEKLTARSDKKTKEEKLKEINKKIERKNFLEKELYEISNRVSNCKESSQLAELSKTLEECQTELTTFQDEETRAGMSFEQCKYELDAIDTKNTKNIEKLIETLKEKQQDFLKRQKVAQDELLNVKKNTHPKNKAILRENLNNVNMGIINLESKIKELEQRVKELKGEKFFALKKKQDNLQGQLNKIRNSYKDITTQNYDNDDLRADAIKNWMGDMQKVSSELQSVNRELSELDEQNSEMP